MGPVHQYLDSVHRCFLLILALELYLSDRAVKTCSLGMLGAPALFDLVCIATDAEEVVSRVTNGKFNHQVRTTKVQQAICRVIAVGGPSGIQKDK